MKKTGAPSKYTLALADRICKELAKGTPLRTICKQPGMPHYATVRRWEVDNASFRALSTRARETGCHAIADECLEIADDATNDWMLDNNPDNPGFKLNGEHVQRSKLRIETRMRLLGKWLPKVYGDKIDANLNHSGGITVNIKQF